MTTRRLGSNGPEVFPLALGCAGLSGAHPQVMDDAESIATIQEAIDRGVNLVDTADFYGGGHNELLIAKAIQGRRDKVVLSDKFGGLRSPDGAFVGIDRRPAAVKNFLTCSLTRLGVDYIDIYRPARLDPHVPIEETIGAISDLVEAGYVRHIGLSEVGPETIRRACAVLPIRDLQIQYSVMTRGPEADIFLVLHELGVAVTAYGVLTHGLLTGAAKPAGEGDPRAHLPRFRGDNFDRNQGLVAAFGEIARDEGVTNSQLAVAWVLAKGPNMGGLDIVLSVEDLARIQRSVPPEAVSGMRYDSRLMAMLDSERTSSSEV